MKGEGCTSDVGGSTGKGRLVLFTVGIGNLSVDEYEDPPTFVLGYGGKDSLDVGIWRTGNETIGSA